MKNNQSPLTRYFLRLWYQQKPNFWLPLSFLYRFFSSLRRRFLSSRATPFTVPVIVIGNITVGGTGKTPVVIHLARRLTAEGFSVGIISRGYGSQADNYPLLVTQETAVSQSGDEALLMARESECPVVIAPDRPAAAKYLLKSYPQTQVLLSDDGLQHYRLHRDMEIVIIDGQRGLGNGHCLPAGPLREPKHRLQSVDHILVNGALAADQPLLENYSEMVLQPVGWLQLISNKLVPLRPFPWSDDDAVKAIAAIGNPERFFATLMALGLTFTSQAFDDHHHYREKDLSSNNNDILLMTTKDGVKCQPFATSNWWALRIEVDVPTTIIDSIIHKIRSH